MPETLQEPPQPKPKKHVLDESRFVASRSVLLTDAFMTWFIKLGGILVVVAVVGIFVFIFSQVTPLFGEAKVSVGEAVISAEPLPPGDYLGIAADEWSEKPFALRSDGTFVFADLVKGGTFEGKVEEIGDATVTAASIREDRGLIVLGSEVGGVYLIDYSYSPSFQDGVRTVNENVKTVFSTDFGKRVTDVAVGADGESRLIAAVLEGEAGPELWLDLVQRKKGLISAGDWSEADKLDLTETLRPGVAIQDILVTGRADGMLVVFANGEVDYHFRKGSGLDMELRQTFRPFQDLDDQTIASIDFLLGDVTAVATSTGGVNRAFSLYRTKDEPTRVFHQTKEFPVLATEPEFFSQSFRNKAFLVGGDDFASLRYLTTEGVRWEGELPWKVTHAALGGKYDYLVFLTEDRHFAKIPLDDPHPETNFASLFGKVWYEGAPEPKFEWQSTGGSDEFEPKLSLIPLIIGSLKGTVYALMFAVPIALFGALYTSEFLHPRNKVFIKPVMEIMASLPSVVLGFLAALWLAPILEDRVPSILCIAILVPAGSFLIGWFWSRQPQSTRKYVPPGREFLYFTPILLLLMYVGWQMGPAVEQVLFTVRDSATGERVGDFTRWWPAVTGTPYEQRNSLVVGFMMGFAVIPIIFTIAEDSMSNVPGAMRSGSLALGASRWQTAWSIVLPTASAGIFSALMIGLGRAVGETMIVVMATGNTPIMDFNIFSGMRTLSANIAVELPEAPHHGTLYRALFLGAVVLFLMTFIVNTVAEILRQHLREKYKTV